MFFEGDYQDETCKSPYSIYLAQRLTWPFQTTNGELMQPFTLQKALMSSLTAMCSETNSFSAICNGRSHADIDYAGMPSLSCPDCESYSGDYLKSKFTIDTGVDSEYEMFPGLADPRTRAFLEGNRIIGGILLTQSRKKLRFCKNLEADLKEQAGKVCLGDTEYNGAYGVDSTFVKTSELYRETNEWSHFYDSSELKDGGTLPRGFFFDMGCAYRVNGDPNIQCSPGPRNFPIMLHIDHNVSKAADMLTFLKDGNYIDSQTMELVASITFLNLRTGNLCLIQVKFAPTRSGGYGMTYEVEIVDTVMYDFEESRSDLLQIFFEGAFLVFFLVLIWTEGKELLEEWSDKGQPLGYFLDPANSLDWLNYSVQIAAIVKWVILLTQVSKFSFELDYMIYDLDAVGRPIVPNAEMGEYQDMLDDLVAIVETRKTYFNLICVSLLLTTLQLLKNLDFHPQMGIVTRTLSGAKADLTFFLMLCE